MFEQGKLYWYFNRHSAWEHAKFLGTLVNAVSKRVYYRFVANSKEVILTYKQTSAFIRNT